MIVTQDERTAARFEASYPIELEANGRPIPGRTLNLGIGGLSLEPGAALPEATPVVCRLEADGRPLEAQGEVAWQYAEDGVYRMGIKFCALSPALAGWLSSVSSSHTAVSQEHAPLSDTQPMRVPVVPEDELVDPPVPQMPVATPDLHAAARIEQLDLWKKGAVPPPLPPAPPAEPITDAAESDVLFDDMPSPEARMMQTRADDKTVAAMSLKHRLAAVATKVREGVAGTTQRVAAMLRRERPQKRERTATTERISDRPRRRETVEAATSWKSRLRLGVLFAFVRSVPARLPRVGQHLQSQRVQLVVAATAVALLIGSGVAFLFAGGGEDAGTADGAATELPVPADNGGSYWDPPAMPVPDQEIAEAAPVPAPDPEPAPAPRRRAAPAQPPPVAIPDMPLPEPPAVGAEPEPPASAVASADELPAAGARSGELVAREVGSGEAAEAEAAGVQARERRSSRPRREERATRERETRERERASRTAKAQLRARSERAEPAERTGRPREERAPEPRTTASAPAAAAGGPTTFRLNLSGTPGPIHTYPLANPNGIVIDVANLQHPGAATKLTSDDPRIRFVKIINREQGVRFIVYLNGALPEYDVTPSGRGVRVALRA